MLIPWSVKMKSKGVWLWEPVQRWEKQINQGANQTEDSWTKITQKANICITKIAFIGRKDYRNAWITIEKWSGSLCNTSQHIERCNLFVSHLFQIHTSLKVEFKQEETKAVEALRWWGRHNQFGGKSPNCYCLEIELPVGTSGSIYFFDSWVEQWKAM